MNMKEVRTEKAPLPIGPYVQAVQSGQMLFVSGQLPIVAETGTMPEDVSEQAAISLNNLKAIIEQAGLTLDKVVKTTVFVKDLNDFAAVNEVYAAFFGTSFPARSCVEVARLPKDAKVEIEAIVVG